MSWTDESWGDPDWVTHAIAAVAEGICPVHQHDLTPGQLDHIPHGWCPHCYSWWAIRDHGSTIVKSFTAIGPP